jgi:rubrerythrin
MTIKNNKKIKELEERMEALVIAVPKEESAYRFYLELARATEHEGKRKMFIKLANQELEHKRIVEKLVVDTEAELIKLYDGDKHINRRKDGNK